MTKITREQVIKLAELSRIEIKDDEIDSVAKQLQDVLTYAERVKEIAADVHSSFEKNINIFAQDIAEKNDPASIIANAPDSQDNFFVVPKIIEDKQ